MADGAVAQLGAVGVVAVRGGGGEAQPAARQGEGAGGFQEGRVSRGCPGHPPGENEN